MNTTTDFFETDHFEVFGDASFIDESDRFDDALTEPTSRYRDYAALLGTSAITIPPSELPAVELPDYEPTAADLAAIEALLDEDSIEDRIASANTLSAFEARHRDLIRLRTELPATALHDSDETDETDELELERAA